jgi:hypothetical protein
MLTRRIRARGKFRQRGKQPYLSQTLAGEDIALVPSRNRQWRIYWGTMILGTFDEKTGEITRPNITKKQKVLPMTPFQV